jgi:hypothetical protein
MKRATVLIVLIGILLLAKGAGEPGKVDTSGMQLMHTTAYCLHGVTATGGTTRRGIAACNTHVGDIAVIYSTDGKYLGTYEITDTGGTEGLQRGTVIDVWKCNYTQCESWMKLTNGKVYVQWIEGNG